MAKLNKLNRILGKKDYYQCPHCGFVLPKKEAIISGWDCMHAIRANHYPSGT